jgi:aerobic-type carbon monoxide dehydrogenase small subunit (CoxS/CutS family)
VGTRHRIEVVVNGERRACETAGRTSLADLLRDGLGLTGTHLGCEHGVCGCCTVLLDGEPVRSCIILAAQADGHSVTTIEGVGAGGVGAGGAGAGGVGAGGVGAGGAGAGGMSRASGLSLVQEAFCEAHALQCGYCTPGMVLAVHALLAANPAPTRDDIDEALGGNICRCTGYVQIREAVELAAQRCSAAGPPDAS